jgi:hypothetical protein
LRTIFSVVYCEGHKIKEDEMGGAWSAYGRKYKSMQNFCRKNIKQKDNLESLGLDRRRILMGI